MKITGEEFPLYMIEDRVKLGLPELIGTLSITRRLAFEANKGLQKVLSPSVWADLVAADWQDPWFPGNDDQQTKRIRGIARKRYSALKISTAELTAARHRIMAP